MMGCLRAPHGSTVSGAVTQRSTVPQLLCPRLAGKPLLFSSVTSLPLRQDAMHRERKPLTACEHGGGERCYPSLFSPRSFWRGSSTADCNALLQRVTIRLIASLLEAKPVHTALHYTALEILPFSFHLPFICFSLGTSSKAFFC